MALISEIAIWKLLDLQLMDCSNAQRVLKRLTITSTQFGCPVQIVSDGGSDLKKAVALFREKHPNTRWVYDIMGRLALLVGKLFEADPHWENLCRQINQSRTKLSVDRSIVFVATQRA